MSELEKTRIREEAKSLVLSRENVDRALAAILYLIKDCRLWKDYGHGSWDSYINNELDFSLRKADYFCHIWGKIEAPYPGLLDKILPVLGWSKTKELAGVVNPDNVDELLEKIVGGKLKLVEVVELVRRMMPKEEGEEIREVTDVDDTGLPKTFKVTLAFEAYQNVMQAIVLSSKLAESQNKGQCLDLICTDFLASNTFADGDTKGVVKFLAKFENQIEGMKIILVDTKERAVIYGKKTIDEFTSSK